MATNTAEDMWGYVEKTSSCWNWTGSIRTNGYGQFMVRRKNWSVHRLAYILIKGEIPQGLVLDHLCRNTICVNPDHLEAVRSEVNMLRGVSFPAINARKTKCKNGHEFTLENTYRPPKRPRERYCKICRLATTRQRRAIEAIKKHGGK